MRIAIFLTDEAPIKYLNYYTKKIEGKDIKLIVGKDKLFGESFDIIIVPYDLPITDEIMDEYLLPTLYRYKGILCFDSKKYEEI